MRQICRSRIWRALVKMSTKGIQAQTTGYMLLSTSSLANGMTGVHSRIGHRQAHPGYATSQRISRRSLLSHLLEGDESQAANCLKCLTILGMSEAMHGYGREALEDLRRAVTVVRQERASVPEWLMSRVELIAADTAKRAPLEFRHQSTRAGCDLPTGAWLSQQRK